MISAFVSDVEVVDEGSIFIFHLCSEDAEEWVREHIGEHPRWGQSAVVVEHRFAGEVAAGMIADGLIVA